VSGAPASAARRFSPAWSPRRRWLKLRDALLASERFQSWAARFWLTRPIARRRARALFDLCSGFVYSQVLLACVRLDLFEHLAGEPRTLDELAERLSLTPAAAERLLKAAVSLGLVQRRGRSRFGLGPLGAALRGNPGIAAMIEHHGLFYADLQDPVALLRGQPGLLAGYWPYARSDSPAALGDEQVAAYSTLMAASQRFIAGQVLDAYSFEAHRCLLDVGGGEGAFVAAAAERWPHLRLKLLDLPAVARRAGTQLAALDLAQRVEVSGGDFLNDPLPHGADVAALVRVLHDHDDAAAVRLLRAVRRALPEDGVLLVAEPMSGTAGAEPVGDAYFGFYLLAMGMGRPRAPAEHRQLLRRAGFHHARLVPTRIPLQCRLLVARPARPRAGGRERDSEQCQA